MRPTPGVICNVKDLVSCLTRYVVGPLMVTFTGSIQATDADVICLVIQVLATVLSWLEQPKDVFACARAAKHLQGIAAYAPLRLHICQAESTARPKHVEDVALVRQTLQGVCRHFKGRCSALFVAHAISSYQSSSLDHSAATAGVQMLDLSNTLVDDADISIAVEECPELQVLKLAGCRKLTSVGEALLAPDTGEQNSKDAAYGCNLYLYVVQSCCFVLLYNFMLDLQQILC